MHPHRLSVLSVLAVCAQGLAPLPAAAMPCANMTLVLAIDGSGSISDAEFAFQMAATARAIMHPQVVDAMAALGGVAVNALIWGDTASGIHTLDWVHVRDHDSAARFAMQLANEPRRVTGNTDMGQAVNAALDLIASPQNCADYNVIDVSGDGRETMFSDRRGVSLRAARQRAEDEGVIINGLAISTQDVQLADYYRRQVIAGTAAFVIEATSFDDFGEAMQRKLLQEVRNYGVMQLADAGMRQGDGG